MNYAATRHLVPPTGEGENLAFPWEADSGLASARQETWLLSFIDILALLLTLFVLLLAYQDRGPVQAGTAVSTADDASLNLDFSLQASARALAAVPALLPVAAPGDGGYVMSGEGLLPVDVEPGAIQSQSTGTRADDRSLPAEATGATEGVTEPATETDVASADVEQRVTEPPAVTGPVDGAGDGDSQPALTAADRLRTTLSQTGLSDRVEMSVQQGVVNLDISDNILFSPASAALSTDGLALLQNLAAVLRTLPYHLSVEGHTDNMPIQTTRYPSNWELSSARAARVTRKLIEQGVAPARIRAIGYGDTRPRDSNDTEAGRSRNRRVTFVLQVEAD